MNDAPQADISKASFEAGCQAHPKYCGTYKLSGTTLTLTLTGANGKPSNSTFKAIGPDKAEIFGVPATKVVRKFTATTKLSGRYSATGGYGSIMSARAYEFRPDGTFRLNRRALCGRAAWVAQWQTPTKAGLTG
jgi:hypothetical protein